MKVTKKHIKASFKPYDLVITISSEEDENDLKSVCDGAYDTQIGVELLEKIEHILAS